MMNRKEYGLLVEGWRKFINESEDVDNMSNESSLRDYKSERLSALFQRIGLDISKLKEYNKDTRSQNDEINFYNKIHGKQNFEPLQIGGFGSGGYLYATAEHTRIKDSTVQFYINKFREVEKLEDDKIFYMFLENFALEKPGMMNSSLPRRNCRDANFIEIMKYIIKSYIKRRYKASARAGYGEAGLDRMRSGYISLKVFKTIVNEIEKTLDGILKKVEVKPKKVEVKPKKVSALYNKENLKIKSHVREIGSFYEIQSVKAAKPARYETDEEAEGFLYILLYVGSGQGAIVMQDPEGDHMIEDPPYHFDYIQKEFANKTKGPELFSMSA